MVNKESVIQLYGQAAVFCCPSIYEPFGIINLEAMACETAWWRAQSEESRK
jgi:glycosyltransferase involved in cell wall biosynthesis